MATLDLDELLAGTVVGSAAAIEPLIRELAADSATRISFRGDLRLVVDGPGPGDVPHLLDVAFPEPPQVEDAARALKLAAGLLREQGASDQVALGWGAELARDLRAQASEVGMRPRAVLQPLRLALTGMTSGPGLDLLLAAIGPEEALRRVHQMRFAIERDRGGIEAGRG